MIKYFSLALIGIVAVGLVYWRAISFNVARYLVWRLTSTATIIKGQVRNANADIHYISYGSGPTVFLLHGGLSSRLSWFSQVPELVDAGWRVILPDTRGHGDSDLGGNELSYRLLAADVVKILDRLSIQRTDVVGWSDGGNTALLLARYWPERVRRMVVISANFNPGGLMPEAREENTSPSRGIERWWKRWWTGAGDRLHKLEARVQRLWRTHPNLQPADLADIATPTLVIVGDADVVSTTHARLMAKYLANGSLAVISGGHFTPVTQARRVNEWISRFLGEGTLEDGS